MGIVPIIRIAPIGRILVAFPLAAILIFLFSTTARSSGLTFGVPSGHKGELQLEEAFERIVRLTTKLSSYAGACLHDIRELKGAIAGLVLGAVLLIGGALLFVSGIGQPGIVLPSGHGGGNLQLWGGVMLMGAGLVTIGGIVSVAIRDWEGAGEEPSDD